MGFTATFWGVRGSIACPTPRHMRYGGNTSCVEVTAGDTHIVLDAGTGIRELGSVFLAGGVTEAHILMSHTHWDHINGFPFFTPAYVPGHHYWVRAGHLGDAGGIRATMAGQMTQPMFPIPLETMRSTVEFDDFKVGARMDLGGGVTVATAPLNHPNGATGYRVEYGGKAVCYVTDTEHVPGAPDRNVLGLIDGADLVIYDSTYTDDEFPKKVGWGHSTWQEGVRLCQSAGVGRLAIFHHDPDHDDDRMDQIAAAARHAWGDRAFAATERLTVEL